LIEVRDVKNGALIFKTQLGDPPLSSLMRLFAQRTTCAPACGGPVYTELTLATARRRPRSARQLRANLRAGM